MPDDSATVIVLGNRYNRSIYKSRSIYASILGLQLGTEDDE